jgi:phage gp46-like protein
MNIFSGDPYITISENGSRLHFKGGQPVMDQGLENMVLISLFTRRGWAGNSLFRDLEQQIGSDFLDVAEQPTTLRNLSDLEQSAIRALKSSVFGRVTATATNPESNIKKISILIEPPGQDSKTIILTKNGQNWQFQAENPAYKRV